MLDATVTRVTDTPSVPSSPEVPYSGGFTPARFTHILSRMFTRSFRSLERTPHGVPTRWFAESRIAANKIRAMCAVRNFSLQFTQKDTFMFSFALVPEVQKASPSQGCWQSKSSESIVVVHIVIVQGRGISPAPVLQLHLISCRKKETSSPVCG